MAKISPLMLLPPIIFAAFAVTAYVGMYRDDPNALPSTRIGQEAPPVPSQALGDNPAVTDEMLRSGEVTILNFWASWCPPCRAEHPTLLQLQAQGFRVIGVNFKDSADDALAYLADEANPFLAVGFDPKGRTAIDWGVTAPPETFILDGNGTVLYRFVGPLIGSDYEQRFLPQLNAAMRK